MTDLLLISIINNYFNFSVFTKDTNLNKMKLTCCFFASALAKSVTQVLEDLTAITSRFNAMTNERSATFPPNKDLLDAVMTWQTDMLEVENNGKDLKRALASGSNLNLQILLSTLLYDLTVGLCNHLPWLFLVGRIKEKDMATKTAPINFQRMGVTAVLITGKCKMGYG